MAAMLHVILSCLALQAAHAFILGGSSQRGVVSPSRDVDSDCVAKALNASCSFYECFEQRFPCGSHGYALAYGGKYCNRLHNARDEFTASGDVFVDKMTACELRKLLPYYQQDTLNCKNFYDQAFVNMGDCYLESGYCDVVVSNFHGFMDTFDKSDFLNLKLVNQVLGAADKCGGNVESDLIREFISSGGSH